MTRAGENPRGRRLAPDDLAAELEAAGRRIIAELSPRDRLDLAGVGWATVELARAEHELGAALGPALAEPFGPAPDDEIMGAYARVGRLATGTAIALLEPNTEGWLAGCLARWGEAVVVAYTVPQVDPPGGPREPARTARQLAGLGAQVVPAGGPLGPALHLQGGRRGPHLILLVAPPSDARHATIGR